MKPNTTVQGIRGEVLRKSYPSQKEIDGLTKIKKKQLDGRELEVPDIEELEEETVGNIILNCLTAYAVKDKKEGFYINLIANTILNYKEGEEIEFKDKIKKFLIGVLEESMVRKTKTEDEKGKEKEEVKGFYAGWLVCQVLASLGVEAED